MGNGLDGVVRCLPNQARSADEIMHNIENSINAFDAPRKPHETPRKHHVIKINYSGPPDRNGIQDVTKIYDDGSILEERIVRNLRAANPNDRERIVHLDYRNNNLQGSNEIEATIYPDNTLYVDAKKNSFWSFMSDYTAVYKIDAQGNCKKESKD